MVEIINSTRSQVPPEIEHTLIWTKVPMYHPDLVDNSIKSRIDQDGLWGFTGNDSPPPSPSLLPSCLPALAEWGITKEKMIVSASPTKEEAVLIERAGKEVHRYVKNRWPESDWETAWFVNPPVSDDLVFDLNEISHHCTLGAETSECSRTGAHSRFCSSEGIIPSTNFKNIDLDVKIINLAWCVRAI